MSNYFYVTTPIYYVNAKPHLGHAYTTIIADIMARYNKLMGKKVFFLTGTDEHGDKIVETARELETTPKRLADENSAKFKALWPNMCIEINRFIRTTEGQHVCTVQRILQDVYDKGDIYFGEYSGHYCIGCERFYAPNELEDGKCPIHRKELVLVSEQNYFFRMEKYRPWLIEYINDHPEFIRPERYKNEVLGMLREPLDDLCISRPKKRLSWGIELPFDPNYVCYVWFDALINYLTGIDYPDGDKFKDFWDSCEHLIAKDILKPHAIYWPTMLKAMGLEPFKHLNVHGYWNIESAKMSKSLGNVVDPLTLKDKYGIDAFRYFLLRDMVFGLDSNFSEEAMVARFNADLANDLGNLVSRSTNMAAKYFKGILPIPGVMEDIDRDITTLALESAEAYSSKMACLEFHNAMGAIWSLISGLNKYIDYTAPWTLASNDTQRLATVMYTTLEGLRFVAIMLSPVMPIAASKILDAIGYKDNLSIKDLRSFGGLKSGTRITVQKALFPRVERVKTEDKVCQRRKESKGETNLIDISEFSKVEIKAGKILDASKIEGSDKLLLLKVDAGEHIQIVAGLANAYSPQGLAGKYVAIVTNLKPTRLMGITSEGMLLAADAPDGSHTLLTFDREPVIGSKVS
ncbi:MAG: methionine--tRNA ligase [Deltaproteobacteria bacterium]|nr:methionine--tRNA ligase [Deltaproteobacteria bacterium]